MCRRPRRSAPTSRTVRAWPRADVRQPSAWRPPFAAERQSLDGAQRQQQNRRPDTDCRIVGQRSDAEGRTAHQQERNQQHRFTAEPVAEVTEQRNADDARKIRGRERAKREQMPMSGTKPGKNTLFNTSADVVANTNRSYHSTVVPITLARRSSSSRWERHRLRRAMRQGGRYSWSSPDSVALTGDAAWGARRSPSLSGAKNDK